MSTNLSEDEVAAVAAFLSSERLAKLRQLTGSNRDAIELHQQMLKISTALMGVTAIIEIALRNAICDRLSVHFNHSGWLLAPPPSFVWEDSEKQKIKEATRNARRAAYSTKTQAEKRALDQLAFPNGVPAGLSHKDHSTARQGAIQLSTGQIIAQLTLFFWKRLYSDDYEQSLWRTALKRVFPNKALKRSKIAENLEKIYQTRNRLAHHEPVYGKRLTETLEAIDFLFVNFGAKNSDSVTPLAKLLEEDRRELDALAAALDARFAQFRTPPPASP
jgi:hypothetical protein